MNIRVFQKISNILLQKDDSYIKIKSTGNCMFPFYSDGDILIIRKQSKYLLGDIVAVIYGNDLLAHRVLSHNGNLYHIKGDNTIASEYVKSDDIIGLVTGKLKNDNVFSYKIPDEITKNIINLSLGINNLFAANANSYKIVMKSNEYNYFLDYLKNIDVNKYLMSAD